MSIPRVLSIQSHMVSGYCGNKAATFPLQLLGFDVDVMNTVNFSNHTGYPSWTGEKATGEQLAKLFEGLQTNDLVDYTHILTVLDPVMGDNGQLYVQPDVIPVYRGLIKFASAITPNQFEAEILTDKKITDVVSCLDVIDSLHGAGVEHVVITSVSLSPQDITVHSSGKSGYSEMNGVHCREHQEPANEQPLLYCVCSSKQEGEARSQVYALGFPTYNGYFTGTGDLFSALLVARLDEELKAERNIVDDVQESASTATRTELEMTLGRGNGSAKSLTALAKACVKVVATMKAVVHRTYVAQKGTSAATVDRSQASSTSVIKRCELRLIQSKKDIEQPDVDGLEAIELRIQ
ncbi:hypothetical protein BG011_004643 [Mortierella polycephala]|uniref:pyridoxal kinase n=1 Tax=Mortierella polycephala TaxID=41804 RepID=A0A9P6Q189_9FUNG|nr:hypothetical protein BG011_004643 [Mortierella polycephala]